MKKTLQQCLSQALMSLGTCFERRLQKADQWRSQQFLSVLAEPNKVNSIHA